MSGAPHTVALDQEPSSADAGALLLSPMDARTLVALPLVAILRAGGSLCAQTTSEVWPELDLYWRPALHQRSMLELSASTEREGAKHEATAGVYQDYLFLPRGYGRVGYRFTFSTRDASYRESRIVLENVLSHDASPLWHLANRVRVEPRWVNGAFSYRVRERVHVQRERRPPRGWALAPYGTAEAYYDSRFSTIARLGGRAGNVFRFSPTRSLDLYLARQQNSRTTPRTIDAFGATLSLTY